MKTTATRKLKCISEETCWTIDFSEISVDVRITTPIILFEITSSTISWEMNFGNRSTELTDALMVKLQNCNILVNLFHGAKHKLKKGKPSEVQCHSKLSNCGNAKG